jgi:hypothetical protein
MSAPLALFLKRLEGVATKDCLAVLREWHWIIRSLLNTVPHDEPPERSPFKKN